MLMMNRKREFEQRFVHDQTLGFRAEARRNKLVGLWAAEKLSMNEDEAADYAQDIVKAALAEPRADSVFRRVRCDFDAVGVEQSDRQIRRTMDELLTLAHRQIHEE